MPETLKDLESVVWFIKIWEYPNINHRAISPDPDKSYRLYSLEIESVPCAIDLLLMRHSFVAEFTIAALAITI